MIDLSQNRQFKFGEAMKLTIEYEADIAVCYVWVEDISGTWRKIAFCQGINQAYIESDQILTMVTADGTVLARAE